MKFWPEPSPSHHAPTTEILPAARDVGLFLITIPTF